MRYYRRATITLSADDLSNPKEVRFQDKERETIDKVVIIDGGGRSETIADATVDWEIPMGNIAQGKWFLLLSDQPFSLKINNGAALVVGTSKVCEMWADFTSLKISNASGSEMRLTWAVGGE